MLGPRTAAHTTPVGAPGVVDGIACRTVHFVIMGCGRVGATLATSLEENGHSVSVIDQNPEAFRRLDSEFGGNKVTGLGFDRDTLTQAGIEEAFAFAAVSDGDNSNILAARVVRETFGIENVVARIYDPHRAEIYQRLGIPTVATVRWTAHQVLRRLLPMGATDEYRDASGQIQLSQVDVHPGWVGKPLRVLEDATGARIAYLTRYGDGLLPTSTTVLQENDTVHVLMRADTSALVERVLTSAPAVTA
jgi:trk system potassium uptake protein TrkA